MTLDLLDDRGAGQRPLPGPTLPARPAPGPAPGPGVPADERVLRCPGADPTIRWCAGERFHHLFEQNLALWGDRPAVSAETGEIPHAGLDRRANRLARHLLRQGLAPGDRVGLFLGRSVWSYVAMLAVSKAGAAWVPLDPCFPRERVEVITEDAGLRLLLSLAALEPRLAGIAVPVLCLDREAEAIAGEDAAPLPKRGEPSPDGLSYIVYTSGSTGRPKGVAVNHSSICNFIRVAAEIYGLRPEDRVYQGMTIAFDFSFEEIWVPLYAGATLVPNLGDGALLGPDLAAFLIERQVTALCCVPTLLATLEEDLPDLRFVLVSGETCPAELVARWHRPERTFLNVYGPTEATVSATWTRLDPGRPVTIGRPLPTYSLLVLDPAAERALPRGEVGEITVGGVGLAQGYVNRPDQTRRVFVEDFLGLAGNPGGRLYRTGDLGRITADGEVECLGRIDTQVKIRGYRIELDEIESVIMRTPGVRQAVVAPYETSPGTTELVAYYTCRGDGEPPSANEIHGLLRDRLPPFMVPTFLEELPALPMLPSHKVDRKSLPPPMGPRHTGDRPFVAPDTPEEEILAGLLAELLGLERVSVEDHVFDDLGASSLLMVRFCGAVRRRLGHASIAIRDVYASPTIRGLAQCLQAARPEQAPAARAEPVHVASSSAYWACGALQALALVLLASLASVVGIESVFRVVTAATLPEAGLRAVIAATGLLALAVLLPLLLKWTVVGRFREETIPAWSLAYLRFWLVRGSIRLSPLALTAGTPLYNLHLRLLGARIGRHAVIACRVPGAIDLLEVGEGAVIRPKTLLNCYEARSGVVETGPISVGRHAYVGDGSVLGIRTALGDGARLGHVSSLHRGQRLPAGTRAHGSPAEPTEVSPAAVPPRTCGDLRRLTYSTVLVLLAWASLVTVFLVAYLACARLEVDPSDLAGIRIDPALVGWVAVASILLTPARMVLALVLVHSVPRLIAPMVLEGRVYPLYGPAYFLAQVASSFSNSRFFNTLLGDSSYIVAYLRLVGYRLDPCIQTGSNFGLSQEHEMPLLCRVGPGTLISDGLTMVNSASSSTSFRLSGIAIGARNFVGNNVVVPPGARVGDNCLLATKVMVPIDGPVRTGTGLLGSPSFAIPRTVLRDRSLEGHADPRARAGRLRLKNIANARAMAVFLAVGLATTVLTMAVAVTTVVLYARLGILVLAGAAVVLPVLLMAIAVLVERASVGFGRLTPRLCSIYDDYYWSHERYWKLSLTDRSGLLAMTAGTPFRSLVMRMLGVKLGKRVLDDGCWISEKTMVEIGDDCTLAEMSTLQGHSLEDAVFKSDRIRLGDRCSIGCNAFVHYGVALEDEVVVAPDAFVMKGTQSASRAHWRGNPAAQELG